MKIEQIKDAEDCFDDSMIKEYFFDREIRKEFILFLGQFGSLQYFPNFPKPFFKLQIPQAFILQGIEGNTHVRVVFSRKQLKSARDLFERIITDFHEGGSSESKRVI